MLRGTFALIITIHGLIHVMGFAKAFGYGNVKQLSKEISKPLGLLWLLSAMLIITATVLFLLRKEGWWVLGITSTILSQLLIFTAWGDAKFGTVVNVIFLIASLLALVNSA